MPLGPLWRSAMHYNNTSLEANFIRRCQMPIKDDFRSAKIAKPDDLGLRYTFSWINSLKNSFAPSAAASFILCRSSIWLIVSFKQSLYELDYNSWMPHNIPVVTRTND